MRLPCVNSLYSRAFHHKFVSFGNFFQEMETFQPEIYEQIRKLKDKYATLGQDLESYLDGLLMSNTTTYWDYLNVDALLALQQPKTDFPDEKIFIMYHQVTELYFKLVLHELEQLSFNGRNVLRNGEDKGWNEVLSADYFVERMMRCNRYFDALTHSFGIMVEGMEPEQFKQYRMALLPASGFQSAQYRKIEICATDFINLVEKDRRSLYSGTTTGSMIEEMFEYSYWKKGATELATGEKTLTLRMFEKKYTDELVGLARRKINNNIWQKYLELSEEDQNRKDLQLALRAFDVNVNVNWPLEHYKSAVRYLHDKNSEDKASTGGTNWQKYLPPRFQKRVFYPTLWSEEEQAEWGKSWVENVFSKQQETLR